MVGIIDRFSIGLLIKTLFSPFRQISADEKGKGIAGEMSVMLDKLISRTIGFILRLATIFVGILAIVLFAFLSILRIIFWLILPFIPIIGIMMMGVVGAPWTLI